MRSFLILILIFIYFSLWVQMSGDSFDLFIKDSHLSEDGGVRFRCTFFNVVAELLDLALDHGTWNFGSTWGKPKNVATAGEEVADFKQPDVVVHHDAKLFENRLVCDASNSSE